MLYHGLRTLWSVFVLATMMFASYISDGDAATDKNTSAKGVSHYIMGLMHDFEGQTEEALAEYEEAAKFDYTSYAIHLRIGANYARLGKFEDAIRELKLASELNPDEIQPHSLLVWIYSDQQDFTKAADEYEAILKYNIRTDPENTQVYKYLAQLYYLQHKYDKAVEEYQKVLTMEPKNAEVMYQLGSIYLETDERPKAVDFFKKALAIDPEHEGVLNSLGYVYAEDGANLNEALDLIQRALSISPDNGAYLDSLGWVYFKKGMFKEALEQLLKASEQFEHPLIYEHIGDTYYKLYEKENALKYWNLSLKLLPEQKGVIQKVENLKIGKEVIP